MSDAERYAVSTVELAGKTVRAVVRSDIGSSGTSPAAELLAETAVPATLPNARIWFIGGSSALAVLLAQRLDAPANDAPRLWATATDLNQLDLIRRTLALNELEQATAVDPLQLPVGKDTVDLIALEVPRDRQLARRWLLTAFQSLAESGTLYLAGPNDQDIRPVIADTERLFGNGQLLTYRRHNRSARTVKLAGRDDLPKWTTEPGIRPGSWYEFAVPLIGSGWLRPRPERDSLQLKSLPGVFSYDRLDPGTELLLEQLPDITGQRVLDIGCGYGVIGLLAALNGAEHVDLVDVNLLAIAAAQANADLLGLHNVGVLASDLYTVLTGRSYDLIVSNPPFHQGKAVDFTITNRLIRQAADHLAPDGRLVLVANTFIRYEPALREHFARVRQIAATSRYQIFAASKPLDSSPGQRRVPRSRRG